MNPNQNTITVFSHQSVLLEENTDNTSYTSHLQATDKLYHITFYFSRCHYRPESRTRNLSGDRQLYGLSKSHDMTTTTTLSLRVCLYANGKCRGVTTLSLSLPLSLSLSLSKVWLISHSHFLLLSASFFANKYRELDSSSYLSLHIMKWI